MTRSLSPMKRDILLVLRAAKNSGEGPLTKAQIVHRVALLRKIRKAEPSKHFEGPN